MSTIACILAYIIASFLKTEVASITAVYTATKGAVDAVTHVLAKELGPKKIRVNSINPGMVETEGVHTAGIIGSDFQKSLQAQTPLGRIGQAEDIAPIAVFLASADSGWLTGETLLARGDCVKRVPALALPSKHFFEANDRRIKSNYWDDRYRPRRGKRYLERLYSR